MLGPVQSASPTLSHLHLSPSSQVNGNIALALKSVRSLYASNENAYYSHIYFSLIKQLFSRYSISTWDMQNKLDKAVYGMELTILSKVIENMHL